MIRRLFVLLIAWGAFQPLVSPANAENPLDELSAKATDSLIEDQADNGDVYFEQHVRPLLTDRCLTCHSSASESPDGNLLLDRRDGWLTGGDLGPAVVPGKPNESLLIRAVRKVSDDIQMPPDETLSDGEVQVLVKWIAMGAPGPRPDAPLRRSSELDIDAARQFWAFQSPHEQDNPTPSVRDNSWPRNPLDCFILAPLERRGLHPVRGASKRALIRRATFDLIGLPPTPDEIQAFQEDDSPGAYSRLVDRLLASPQYGQRWGRFWLDVARYADSNGLDENIAHGNAWRYRDYVIRSFGDDKPYDQFVLEQLAGDLLAASSDGSVNRARTIATGFLVLGPKVLAEVDETKMEMDIIDEQVSTVSRALMALTLSCARCHDHKFDPISIEDYYALAGIFKSTRTMEHFKKVARWNEVNVDMDPQVEASHAHPDMAMAVSDYDAPTDLKVHVRGSHLTQTHVVRRRVPKVFHRDNADAAPIPSDGSGRLQLAQWLVSGRHPLVARVIVNRLWRWHFGRGIVASTDNFGKLGDRPTNRRLLDWLAVRLVEDEWSIKSIHRLIMLSNTYRLSSDDDRENRAVDPTNELHWRADVRRLEAEAIRDAMLAASGRLDFAHGGSLLHVKNREFLFDHTSQDRTKYASRRRSVYLPVIRNHLYDGFQLFDYADASVMTGDRASTVVAPQALFLMNGNLVQEAAASFAERLGRDSSWTTDDRLDQAYLLALGRPATESERQLAREYLERSVILANESGESDAGSDIAWVMFCQALFMSNEFMYVR